MSPFKFYCIYQAIHLHFTSTYDVIKYGFKASKSINKTSFENRKDHNLFESWASHFQSEKIAGQHCIANFVYNERSWLYQSKEQSTEIYLKWKSIRESQLHHIKNDFNVLSQIVETKKVDSIFDIFTKTPAGKKPPLLQLFLAGHISKEFICVLNHWCYPFLLKWENEYEIDPLISDQIFILRKYSPFIVNTINSTKVEKMFKELQK
jgi:hypothetical protein